VPSIRTRDGGGRLLGAATLALTAVGVGVLFRGLADASPLTWGYTEAEREAAHDGRLITGVAAALLLGAAALMAYRGRPLRAAVIASPGVVCLVLVVAFPPPGGAWGLIAFVPLAPAAVVAAALPLRRVSPST
jgi:hypothetical protein